MQTSLVDLIARMTVRDGTVNSDQSVSWDAHREAETLSDASLINELVEYVQHESKQDLRRAAYFYFRRIGREVPRVGMCRNSRGTDEEEGKE
jgi:hypothetical protein